MNLGVLDPSPLLRRGLLEVSQHDSLRNAIEKAPISRGVVNRFVAGADNDAVTDVSEELASSGRMVTIDYLGEDTLDAEMATETKQQYLDLLEQLSARGLTADGRVEVSLKLSALGQALGHEGHDIALENAREICRAAANAGTTVTLDMEDHSTTDATLQSLRELRQDFPWVGAVVQAYLHRTESDCRDLAHEGSRVRLCKGAYAEPESVAYQDKSDVDKSYVRCLKVLMAGDGYPMVASHDPRLVEITGALADRTGRSADSFEYQMLLGIRPDEQKRLVADGSRVRVYTPYGDQWYGYLVRRMAERPANMAFFARSVLTTG
ncbi:MAG TPA: proline dehydrogenase family protein [Ornithinimicrobium sp.]|uniref:proline dehydrogenase family protein n=1 Tax=Ornithinimicrobium sp. TaxID=1977084 RepID=UPI002B4707BA|nr:proline dehydrogenase family protein [Ornithinimicrobium sp.]HKJ12088.1 proline dehydrogenase family protein [Ornithinimicrobium sp.]